MLTLDMLSMLCWHAVCELSPLVSPCGSWWFLLLLLFFLFQLTFDYYK